MRGPASLYPAQAGVPIRLAFGAELICEREGEARIEM
jgi:hypothetical protein